jgi:hypothetical protein
LRGARAFFSSPDHFFHPSISGLLDMAEPRLRAERARVGMARIFARLAALLVSLALGPLAAALLVVLLLFAGLKPEEIGVSPVAVSGPLLVGGVFLHALPAAILSALAGLFFIARERIPLWGALVTASICALVALAAVSEDDADVVLVSEAAPLAVILALVSAAICWRATKRWHSP